MAGRKASGNWRRSRVNEIFEGSREWTIEEIETLALGYAVMGRWMTSAYLHRTEWSVQAVMSRLVSMTKKDSDVGYRVGPDDLSYSRRMAAIRIITEAGYGDPRRRQPPLPPLEVNRLRLIVTMSSASLDLVKLSQEFDRSPDFLATTCLSKGFLTREELMTRIYAAVMARLPFLTMAIVRQLPIHEAKNGRMVRYADLTPAARLIGFNSQSTKAKTYALL